MEGQYRDVQNSTCSSLHGTCKSSIFNTIKAMLLFLFLKSWVHGYAKTCNNDLFSTKVDCLFCSPINTCRLTEICTFFAL